MSMRISWPWKVRPEPLAEDLAQLDFLGAALVGMAEEKVEAVHQRLRALAGMNDGSDLVEAAVDRAFEELGGGFQP